MHNLRIMAFALRVRLLMVLLFLDSPRPANTFLLFLMYLLFLLYLVLYLDFWSGILDLLRNIVNPNVFEISKLGCGKAWLGCGKAWLGCGQAWLGCAKGLAQAFSEKNEIPDIFLGGRQRISAGDGELRNLGVFLRETQRENTGGGEK